MASAVVSDNFETSTGAIPSLGGADVTTRLCSAWVNFNGSGTVAIRDSYNVSSITDQGVGRYDANFTTYLPNATYSAVFQSRAVNDNAGDATYVQDYSASYVHIKHYENGTNRDAVYNSLQIFGN